MAMEITGSYDAYVKAENTGISKRMDTVSKGIQIEIAGRQSELKSLSENGEMSAEEKRQKKQEISQEIEELKKQLRERQLEKRREEQQKAKEAMGKQQNPMGEAEQVERPETSALPDNNMQTMVSASLGISKAEQQGNVAVKMENQASVLASEIKQDAARGKETKAKEAELEKIEKRAMRIASSPMPALKTAKEDSKKPENNTLKNIPGVEYKQDGKKAANRFFHSSLDIKG